ncbi:hypothetical protein MRB53_008847 [Persea americana]|uniref:Uncharacterized protein n=1 Tax=Persea americana TaxID=3435 RepID=A0ACC2LMP6_PERAE|nr:hypothetical protein MRB53_008847 [Persea americana]
MQRAVEEVKTKSDKETGERKGKKMGERRKKRGRRKKGPLIFAVEVDFWLRRASTGPKMNAGKVNLHAAHFKGTENEEEKEGVETEKGDEDDEEEVVPTT